MNKKKINIEEHKGLKQIQTNLTKILDKLIQEKMFQKQINKLKAQYKRIVSERRKSKSTRKSQRRKKRRKS